MSSGKKNNLDLQDQIDELEKRVIEIEEFHNKTDEMISERMASISSIQKGLIGLYSRLVLLVSDNEEGQMN